MGSEWQHATLGNIVELKRGYDLPQRERLAGNVPIVSTSGVTDYHSVAMVKGPGVVTGRYGTLGEVYYVEEDFWPLNTTLYIRDFKGNDPRFIGYFLKKLDFLAYSDKAAVPGLNRNHLHQAKVYYPADPLEQRAIAQILGALDDKIELNRRMNETLEAMARAIFRSWFVDFEPVRAKAAGRGTGLPTDVADLFPDSFEESELGEIPAGWRVTRIDELLELAYGKALKGESRRRGAVPVFGSNGQIGWHDEVLVQGPGIVVGRKGNPGTVTWAPTSFFCIDTTFYVVPRDGLGGLHFLYYALREQDLGTLSADSAVPGLNRNLAYMSKQVLPFASIVQRFSATVGPMFDRIHHNAEESRTLVAVRDALLPKLLSGEVRVGDVERVAAGAGVGVG